MGNHSTGSIYNESMHMIEGVYAEPDLGRINFEIDYNYKLLHILLILLSN